MELKQLVYENNEISWGVSGEPPTIRFGHSIQIDPTPGYAHNLADVAVMLAKVEALFPIICPPKVWITKYEALGRFNATTYHDHDYDTRDQYKRAKPLPWIVMWGKRVPPMPGMTRYLVAHEYGHCVEEHIAHLLYTKDNPQIQLRSDYAKLRGVEDIAGTPGVWHRAPGEIFANDFRLLACNVEIDYWPHDVARPEAVPAVMDWWKARLYEVAEARDRTRKAEIARTDSEAVTTLAVSGASAPA